MSKVRGGQVFVEIGADPRKFFAALNTINKRIGSLGASMSSAGAKMASVGAGIVGPIFASAKAFSDVGSALNDMSKRTGVAIESLSVLKFAAEQTGTDMGSVETAVKKMQKAIFAAGNGSKEAAGALAEIGLSAQDLAGLSADQQMAKIADGLMAIEDPGTRAALAMRIFGKAGTDILPMLEGGSAGMAQFAADAARLGLVMDSETAAKADALGDSLDALGAAMKMAFIQIGSAVAPILTSLAGGLATFAAGIGKTIQENQSLVVTALRIGAALSVAGAGFFALGKTISLASSAFGGIAAAAGGVFSALKTVGSVVGFIGMSFVKAITSAVAYSTASVASAVASGAAWAAANAPLIILAGLLAAAGAAAFYAMGGFEGIGAAIGSGLNQAAADGMVVLSDLANTATTTFEGIYAAIAEGDLAGAMDVLWAGLYAGWLRGVEAIMGAVDPWVSMFQNAFTILGAEIYKIWDSLWTNVGSVLNTAGAYLLGAFDNIINPILAAWDTLEAGIRKSWNRIQSFLKKGFDLKKENDKVDSEMAARKREREVSRPGIEGRTDKAAQENAQASQDLADRQKAIDANTEATIAGREAANQSNADARRSATQAAESNLANLTAGAGEGRKDAATAAELMKSLGSASSLDEITNIGASMDALLQRGNVSGEMEAKLLDAYYAAFSRVNVASAAASPSEKAAAGAGAAGTDAATSKAEVAGTFSSVNLGGMGFGSSLAERQLKALETIASNTANMEPAAVGE